MRSALPRTRCALTAPFHPYLLRQGSGGPRPCGASAEQGVCFLWRCPWDRSRRALPAALSPWSPDFPRPPSPEEGGSRGRPAVWPGRTVRHARLRVNAGRSLNSLLRPLPPASRIAPPVFFAIAAFGRASRSCWASSRREWTWRCSVLAGLAPHCRYFWSSPPRPCSPPAPISDDDRAQPTAAALVSR